MGKTIRHKRTIAGERDDDDPVYPSQVFWSDHAVDRVGEKIGFSANIRIPNRVILKAAGNVRLGRDFKVRMRGVVYVCVKVYDGVLVVTTYPDEKNGKACTLKDWRGSGDPQDISGDCAADVQSWHDSRAESREPLQNT